QAGRFHRVVDLAHRRVHRVDGNEAQPEVLVEVLVRRNVAAPLLQAKLHLDLAALADGTDVDVFVQHLDVAIGLDHATGNHPRLIGAQVDHLRRVPGKLEGDLLQVENDVGGVLDHAWDRLELVQHPFDLYRGDGRALNRGQQHPPQRVADGG